MGTRADLAGSHGISSARFVPEGLAGEFWALEVLVLMKPPESKSQIHRLILQMSDLCLEDKPIFKQWVLQIVELRKPVKSCFLFAEKLSSLTPE